MCRQFLLFCRFARYTVLSYVVFLIPKLREKKFNNVLHSPQRTFTRNQFALDLGDWNCFEVTAEQGRYLTDSRYIYLRGKDRSQLKCSRRAWVVYDHVTRYPIHTIQYNIILSIGRQVHTRTYPQRRRLAEKVLVKRYRCTQLPFVTSVRESTDLSPRTSRHRYKK